MRFALAGLLAATFLAACDAEQSGGDHPAAAGDKIFDMPYLQRDLDNGLRVIIVATDYPDIVSLQIPVQTGSRNEVEPGRSGFAHFFEHMMFRGTRKYPVDKYLEIMTNAGANQNAYTTDDYTNYYIRFTKADLEKILEVEADRFMNLEYGEDVFRTEALAVKGEYLKNYSNPTSKAYERLRDLAFDRHTYGHTTMGFIEDIEQMPEQYEYSKVFFDRWYRPEKAAIILVGDLDPGHTFELVEKYFGDWQPGSYDAEIPQEPPLQGPLYEHIAWDAPAQPWIMTGFRGPAFVADGRDMPAIDVLAAVYFSESSALYRKLVLEEQLVDRLHVLFPNRKDPHVLTVYTRLTDAAHAAAVETAIRETLATARSRPVSGTTLADTKSRLKYDFAGQLDNASAIAGMLAGFVHFNRDPETVNALYRSYDALTAGDLLEVANRYFVDAGRVTVTLSNGEALEGVDGMASVDALVSPEDPVAESTNDPATPVAASLQALPAADGTSSPIDVVAQPLPASPLVDVQYIVHAGAAMDPAGKKGLAALTAAMIADAGSETWTIEEINDAMYPIAAGFSAQVDKEMTRFAGQVHRDNLATWYQLASSQLLAPGFRDQDFRRVRQQLVNAIRSDLVANNDEELGKEVLYRQVYGASHPYGSLNQGHSADIEKLTLADVQGFYRRYYSQRNLTVGLAGGYPEGFARRVAADLAVLPTGERASIRLPEPAPITASRATIVSKDTPAVAVSIGFPIDLTRADRDWVALWLVRSWLGEHRNSNGRLFQRIREARGMNYGNYAYIEYFPRGMFRSLPDTGLVRQQQLFQLWLRPLRSNQDAHFATRAALHELDTLLDAGMSEQAFENTRNYLSKFVSLLTDGQSRRLGYAIDSRYYGMDDFSSHVRESLARLTLADVNRVLREQLRADRLQYVFVTGDAPDLAARLAGERPSPMTYDADMPAALLAEDRAIEARPLGLDDDRITIVAADRVFR